MKDIEIPKNNDIFCKTGRLWKRTSPYQFLSLRRVFKALIYILHFCRNIFQKNNIKNMHFDVSESQCHVFARSHLANVERAVNRQPGYRSADS